MPAAPVPAPHAPVPPPPPSPVPAPGLDDDLDITRERSPLPGGVPRRRSRSDRFTSRPEHDAPAPDLGRQDFGRQDFGRQDLGRQDFGRPDLGQAFAEVAAPAFDLPVPEPRWSGVEDDLPRLQVPPLEPPRLRTPPSDPLEPGWTPAPHDSGYDPLTSPVPPPPEPLATSGSWAPPPAAGDDEVDPDLVALAGTLVHPTTIVWSRPRRRQHFEAVLHRDGAIQLADGSRYWHPDHAASAASGSPTADGWSVWRLGAEGPTLMDAFRHRFA